MRVIFKASTMAKWDEEQGVGFFWANVCELGDGTPVVDLQNEVIRPETLERAGFGFMKEYQVIGRGHREETDVVVVSFLTTTEDIQKVLCCEEGKTPVGILIGLWFPPGEIREAAKSGELAELSIGGTCERRPLVV